MSEFQTRVSVIRALMIRDLMVRFGRYHLGFVWTVLEPMILTAGVMLLYDLYRVVSGQASEADLVAVRESEEH